MYPKSTMQCIITKPYLHMLQVVESEQYGILMTYNYI